MRIRRPLVLSMIVGLASALSGGAFAWQLDPGLAQEYPILVQAIEHAKRDVQSEVGLECFLSLDGDPIDTGMDPNEFDDDDEGPTIDVEDLSPWNAFGLFRDAMPDNISVDLELVQDAQAGDAQAFEVLVATIVHETTHWVDLKQDGVHTPPESGCAMEVWLYGWSKQLFNVDGIQPEPVSDAVPIWMGFERLRLAWPICRTASPNSLGLKISLDRSSYKMGEAVTVQMTLTNISSSKVTVVNRFDIAGSFASFDIIDPNFKRVEFTGPLVKPAISSADFVMLDPGASLDIKRVVNADSGGYPLTAFGTHTLDIKYHLPPFSCPPFARNLVEGDVVSNRVSFDIVP